MSKYINNRFVLCIFLILMLAVFFNSSSFAVEKYPIRPVTIILHYGPGGSTDMEVRTFQPYLKKALGAPAIIIEYKPGARGLMGTSDFLKAKADGYTLFWECGVMVINKLANEAVDYEIEDFVPVIGSTSDPRTFFVRKDSPYNNLQELIDDARKRPNKITIAYNNNMHYYMLTWMKNNLNMPVNLVGYPGGSPATTALIGGHVDCQISGGLGRLAFKDKIKAIGVFSSIKSKVWPEAMSISEIDIVKKENISIPEKEWAAKNVVWIRREVKENYPERYYKLVASFYEAVKDPGFIKRADDLGLSKTLVCRTPSEVEEIRSSSVKLFQASPELFEVFK